MSPEMIAGGGLGALIAAAFYGLKLLVEWQREKRAGDTEAATTPITNAKTANELLVETLQSVSAERKETRERLDSVEALLEKTRQELNKERMIREQQAKRVDEHDREINHIKRQFALAVTYIRSLLAFITERGLSNDAPEPPSGLHIS